MLPARDPFVREAPMPDGEGNVPADIKAVRRDARMPQRDMQAIPALQVVSRGMKSREDVGTQHRPNNGPVFFAVLIGCHPRVSISAMVGVLPSSVHQACAICLIPLRSGDHRNGVWVRDIRLICRSNVAVQFRASAKPFPASTLRRKNSMKEALKIPAAWHRPQHLQLYRRPSPQAGKPRLQIVGVSYLDEIEACRLDEVDPVRSVLAGCHSFLALCQECVQTGT